MSVVLGYLAAVIMVIVLEGDQRVYSRYINNIYSDSYMALSEEGLVLIDYSTQFSTADFTPDQVVIYPATLSVGGEYPYSYSLTDTFDNEYQHSVYEYTYVGSIVVHGIENISTPLGDFSALRITDSGTSTDRSTTTMNGSDSVSISSGSMTYSSTSWFVRGVGLVKEESDYDWTTIYEQDSSYPEGYTDTYFGSSTMIRIENELWTGALGSRSGWKYLDWFGWFELSGFTSGWLYHEDLEFLYAQGEDTNDIWIYRPANGWMYTNSQSFPFLYSTSLKSWIYYIKEHHGFLSVPNNVWYEQEASML